MKILIPMDLTEVAINALEYAIHSFEDASFQVIHVAGYKISNQQRIDLKEEIRDLIAANLNGLELDIKIDIHILSGQIISELKIWTEQNNLDCVVMGTRDKYDFLDRWVGTISLGLVKTLQIPIYLIPRFSSFKPYSRVLVASDYHPDNTYIISYLKKWNKPYHAFIKFLHVRTGDSKDEAIDRNDQIVQSLFASGEPTFGFEISVMIHKDITESLLKAAYDCNADVMIVIPDNQSFLHSLLFKSLSKDLIMKSAIPILFIHKGDQL